ncbi:hypothetical protein [Butyrivibrio sp. LC3010]|uniref:hypothetical protein n=1 Tax=Butyrivibrio sp. LC3010 TaxID=1280680 RepID=UPI0004292FAB|nr:hypothetical protein [Butyrivibrio sp. LC3010]
MENGRIKNEIKKIIISITLATVVLLMSGVMRPLYADVDNFTISLVTNGLYDTENYCIHLHPLLCIIIKMICMVFPKADGFLLLSHFLIWLELTWIVYLSLTLPKSRAFQVGGCGLAIFVVIATGLFSANYTIQGASFVFTGWLTFFVGNCEKKTVFRTLGIVFIFFGTMWRIKAALIFLPFIILELFTILYESLILSLKKQHNWTWNTIVFAMVIILIISQNYVEKTEQYSDAVRYDQERTILEDYPVLEWNDISGKLNNIDELDYDAVLQWFLLDTDRLNSDTYGKIASVAATTRYPLNLSGIKTASIIMVKFVISQTKVLWLVLINIILTILIILFSKIALYRKVESILAVLGGIIILLYFTILGRAFLRIWYAVIYAIFLILLLQVIRMTREDGISKKQLFLSALIAIISIISVMLICIHQGFTKPNTALLARSDMTDELFEKTCIGNDFYFWGDWFTKVSDYYMSEGRLPKEEFLNHNSDVGSWVFGQKYYIKNLADVGISNPIKALLERDNTYYIADDCQFALKYVRRFYGEDIEAVQVDVIYSTPVWKFVHASKS